MTRNRFAARLCSESRERLAVSCRDLRSVLPSDHNQMGPAFLSALLRVIESDGSPIVLVFDKFDSIESSALIAEIGSFVYRSCAECSFCHRVSLVSRLTVFRSQA